MEAQSRSSLVSHLISKGLAIFPLSERGKTPIQQGWQKAATTAEAVAQQYWSVRPFNIGVATGRRSGGLVVLDWDRGTPQPGEWPETFSVSTRKGVHLYFRDPVARGQSIGWRSTETEQIDVKAEGGLVVGPGSCIDRDDGSVFCYEILSDAPIAPLPDYGFPEHHERRGGVSVDVVDYQGHDTALFVEVAEAILERMMTEEAGGRNNRLFQLACQLSEIVASGRLSASWLDALARAGVRAGLDGGEAQRAVWSAWRTVTGKGR